VTYLNESVVAPENLTVCKPLKNRDVCCDAAAFDQLRNNFNTIKTGFKNFVKTRKKRIENITKEFKFVTKFSNITDILATDDAMFDLPDIKHFKKDAKSPWKRKHFDEGGHDVDDSETSRFLEVVRNLNDDLFDKDKKEKFKEKVKKEKEDKKKKRKYHIDGELQKAR